MKMTLYNDFVGCICKTKTILLLDKLNKKRSGLTYPITI